MKQLQFCLALFLGTFLYFGKKVEFYPVFGYIIRMPESFDKKLSEEIIQLEEEYKMPHVTSWERIAKKEGKREGKLETARELIKRGVDINIIAEATGFSREEIEKLAEIVH